VGEGYIYVLTVLWLCETRLLWFISMSDGDSSVVVCCEQNVWWGQRDASVWCQVTVCHNSAHDCWSKGLKYLLFVHYEAWFNAACMCSVYCLCCLLSTLLLQNLLNHPYRDHLLFCQSECYTCLKTFKLLWMHLKWTQHVDADKGANHPYCPGSIHHCLSDYQLQG